MLQPKRTKYRKFHRGRMKGIRTKGSSMVYGEFGLKAEGPGWVSAREIEAARRAITGYVKRGGQLWVLVLMWSLYHFDSIQDDLRFLKTVLILV